MRRDDAYLLDMLVAARKAVSFSAGLTYPQFVRSDLHQNAIFKVLEIVGEGASRVGEDTRQNHPEISWHQIVGLRNRIVHAYFEVDLDVVWRIVKEDVPILISHWSPWFLRSPSGSDGGRISPRTWSAMRQSRNEIGHVFDRAVAGAEDGSNVMTSRWTPAVDIREDSGQKGPELAPMWDLYAGRRSGSRELAP